MGDLQLTPHFGLTELGGAGAPIWIVDALRQTAQLLEVVRHELGDRPLKITSGYRTRMDNARVGGSLDSQHLDGTAADFVVTGLSLFSAYYKLQGAIAAGRLRVGEIEYSLQDGHIHVSRPTRRDVNQVLIELREGSSTAQVTAELLAQFPGAPTRQQGVVLALAAVGLAVAGATWEA